MYKIPLFRKVKDMPDTILLPCRVCGGSVEVPEGTDPSTVVHRTCHLDETTASSATDEDSDSQDD